MHLRAAAIQLNSRNNPAENLATVEHFLEQAADMGAQFVSLPEFWTYLGPYSGFDEAAQTIPGPAIAQYRKIHLFDVDLANGEKHYESERIVPGNQLVTAEIEGITFGLTVCYDLRFPELYRSLALRGAQLLMVPAGFTLNTGRDHWEVLLRARAIENFCYVIAPAQVGQYPPNRQCFGRSMVIDPWGLVLAQAQDMPSVIMTEIDLEQIARVRAQIPSLDHRQPQVYEL